MQNDDRKAYIGVQKTTYFLTFGKKCSENEKEILLAGGQVEGVLSTTRVELVYNFAPEIWEAEQPDSRSIKYIESIKKKIGFIKDEITDQDSVIKEADKYIKVWFNADKVALKKIDNMWVAEYCECGIDTFTCIAMYFDHKPSVQEISTAATILDIELHFRLYPKDCEFNCRECGKRTHWVDGNGKTLREKWINFTSEHECQYC